MATLTQLHNIFDITDRTTSAVVPGKPLYLYIGDTIPGCDLVVSVNGIITEDYEYIVKESDSIGVVPILEGGGGKKSILRIVAMIALMVAAPAIAASLNASLGLGLQANSIGMMLLRGAISTIGGMIVDALLPPPKPDNTTINSEPSDISPTYSFSGGSNAREVGSTLPIMLGKARVAPPIIASYLSLANDNQYLNILMAVNDGTVDSITDVYIQDQPIGNYAGVDAYTTLGTVHQETIGNFRDTIVTEQIGVTIDNNPAFSDVYKGTLTPGGCSLQSVNNSLNSYSAAFSYKAYSQGSGCADSTLRYNLTSKYRMKTSDGTFYGDGHYLWQGRTVTGADTSHNGDTTVTLQYSAVLGVSYHQHTTAGVCDALEVVLHLSRGLYHVNDDGSYSSRSIGIKIEAKSSDSTVWNTYYNENIEGVYKSPTRKVFIIEGCNSKKFDIRVTRTSLYDEDSRTANSLTLDYINAIIYDDFRYPGVALLSVQAMATDQLNGGFPNISCLVDNTTIVVNGITKSKSNPAWAVYDLLQRYGVSDNNIDLVEFSTWATFCDTKNYKCNLYLDNQMELQAALNMISLLGRATVLQFGTKFRPVVDMPIDIPTQSFLFTSGNISEISLSYIPYFERSNVVEVTYYDETDGYKAKTIQVQSPYFDGVVDEIKSSINLYGCTLANQATSYAQFLLNCNQYITKSATINVDVDAISCTIGDVIKIGKKYMTNTIADGRIVSATSNSIKLDQMVQLEIGMNYEIQFRASDDVIHIVDIPSVLIQFNTTTDTIPTPTLSVIPEQFDVFAFGYQDTESTDLFRVVNISRSSDQKKKITAIEYIPDIYNDVTSIDVENVVFVSSIKALAAVDYIRKATSGIAIECVLSLSWVGNALWYDIYLDNKKITRSYQNFYDVPNVLENYTYNIKVVDSYGKYNTLQYTTLGRYRNPDPVTSLTVSEIGSTYTLSWGYATKPIDFKEYIVYLQGVEIGRTSLNEFSYYSTGLEQKEFSVRAVDSVNLLSSPVTIYGQAVVPQPVGSVSATVVNGKLSLTWVHDKEPDFAKYLIYKDTVIIGSATEKTFSYTELGDQCCTNIYYFVSVVDVSGLESSKVTTIVNIVPATVNSITYTFDKNSLLLRWDSTAGTFSIEKYKITINGDTYYAGANTFSVPVKWLGTKSVTIAAIDTAGNIGTSSSINILITAPSAPTITTAVSITSGIEFLWTEPTIATVGVKEYEVTYNGSITALADRRYFVPTIAQGTYTISIVAIDNAGNRGDVATKSITIGKPVVSSVSYIAKGRSLTLSWTGTASTFNIKEYKLTYSDGSGITQNVYTPHAYYSVEPNWVGTKVFTIAAVDIAGNIGTAITHTTTISGPGLPTLTYSIVNKDALISIKQNPGSFDLSVSEIKYDTLSVNASAGTPIFTVPVTWDGGKVFTVTSVDVLGNRSTSATLDIMILESEVTNITAEVVDNNVLLRWGYTPGTLPVDVFRISKGSEYATSVPIGDRKGTFTTTFEQLGGVYTYWITPIDTAGNDGKYKSIVATVNEPPDYVLNAAWTSDWTGDNSNITTVGEYGYLPTNKTETYQEHFTSRSWTTIQNQIDDGYPLWLSPTNNVATYSQVFDYGALLPSTSLTITNPTVVVFGTGTYAMHWSVEISTNGTTWTTEGTDVTKLFLTGMRYLRITYTFTASNDKTLLQISNYNVTLNTKIRNDTGNGITALASDAGGTYVEFNVDFIDIESIGLTPKATDPIYMVYDFEDIPYPTGFYVYAYNSQGHRVDAQFSWSARGY